MLHELFILKLLPKLLRLCCHRIILKEVDVIFLPQNSLIILLDRVCLGIIVGLFDVVLDLDVNSIVADTH